VSSNQTCRWLGISITPLDGPVTLEGGGGGGGGGGGRDGKRSSSDSMGVDEICTLGLLMGMGGRVTIRCEKLSETTRLRSCRSGDWMADNPNHLRASELYRKYPT
jgi:hypothetical protein